MQLNALLNTNTFIICTSGMGARKKFFRGQNLSLHCMHIFFLTTLVTLITSTTKLSLTNGVARISNWDQNLIE